nr:hypothetical protein [Enterobacter cloacae]
MSSPAFGRGRRRFSVVGRGTWLANRRWFYDDLFFECCN